ncbi:thiopeptide-type bacteriocin biosynthesis protein [Streptomyces sp. NPDC002506]|uniref:thiopeptide-type bacteriocin biosynthesis protein n=1 Tax=Streptomyces sp. NPDC002506 TaxID=3154536 RepID=UPI003324DD00
MARKPAKPDPVTAKPCEAYDWVGLHVFHGGDLDDLLTRSVAPLVRGLEATGRLTGWFFERSRLDGPHLRLRLLPTRPEHVEDVRRTAHVRLTVPMTAGEAVVRQYGTKPLPDGPVRVEQHPYVRELEGCDHLAAMPAIERHFTESSNLALALLAGGPTHQRLMHITLTHLTSALAASGLSMGETSVRALECLEPSERPYVIRGARAAYQVHGSELRAWTSQMWTRPDTGGWPDSIRALAAHLTGTAPATAPAALPGRRGRRRWDDTAAGTDVHEVLSHCAHLFANRVGVTPQQEAHLRLLLAQTLNDLSSGRPNRVCV